MSQTDVVELVLQGGGPISRQIAGQLRRLILSGVLHAGEELPTVREVAVGLAVNPNAIGAAYTELEREGWLTGGDGSGTFVAAPPAVPCAAEPLAELEWLCDTFLTEAWRRGFVPADVLLVITRLLDRSPSS